MRFDKWFKTVWDMSIIILWVLTSLAGIVTLAGLITSKILGLNLEGYFIYGAVAVPLWMILTLVGIMTGDKG